MNLNFNNDITPKPKQLGAGAGNLHMLSQLTTHDKVIPTKQVPIKTVDNARSIFNQHFQSDNVQKSALLKLKSRDSH